MYCAVAHVICQACDVGLAMAFQLPFVISVGLFAAMYYVQKPHMYNIQGPPTQIDLFQMNIFS